MLNLNDFPKFKSDIQGRVTNVHPVVVINSDPPIYLSQNDEILVVDDTPTEFKSLNLKVPSIKESIDLESRNMKINNMTLTLSNKWLFSDLLATQNFLNVYVDIYWKSQSCTNLNDCLPIYKATIKRINHDYNNVKIILEDLTESVMHKEVPIGTLSSENAYREKDINKDIPMVYGDVQKAPCVLYKDVNQDISTMKKIYALADRYEVPIEEGITISSDGYDQSIGLGSGWTSLLYVYSGAYLKVMANLVQTSVLDEGVDTSAPSSPSVQLSTETWDTDLNATRTWFRATYNGSTPTNTIAMGIMQVIQNRRATSWSILDEHPDSSLAWLGEDDNIAIDNKLNAIDGKWETFSSVPDSSINTLDDIPEAEDGWIPIANFWNGTGGNPYNTGNTFSYSAFDNAWDELSEEISTNLKYWHIHRNANRELGNSLAGKVEFICLPDTRRLYDLFNSWYSSEWDIPLRTFSSNIPAPTNVKDNFYNHCWATPFDIPNPDYHYYSGQLIPGENYTDNLGRMMTEFSGGTSGSSFVNYDNMPNRLPSGVEMQDAHVPNYLFKIARDIELDDDYHPIDTDPIDAYVTFSKDFEGSPISGYNAEVLGDRPRIDFWDLLSYHNISYNNIPRYKIVGLNSSTIIEDSGNEQNTTYFHFRDDLEVHSNGVDSSYWGNTGYRSTSYPWDAHREIDLSPGGSPYNMQHMSYIGTDASVDWNNFFSDSQWHIHFLEDHQFGGSGITAPKGLMMPGSMSMPIFKEEYQNAGFTVYPDGVRVVAKNKIVGSYFNDNANYLTLKVNEHALGFLFSFSDTDVEDAIGGSGFTYFYGKVDLRKNNNIITDTSNCNLELYFRVADIPTEEEEEEGATIELSDNVGTLASVSLSDLKNDTAPISSMYDALDFDNETIYNMDSPFSFDWDIPSSFDAAMIYFQIKEYSPHNGAQAVFGANVHNLGVKHVFEIENIYDKNFYLETKGRCGENISEGSPAPSIIRDIIETELEIPIELHESFYEIDDLMSNNWNMAFSVKEKMESKKLIEDIARNTPIIPLFRSNAQLGMAIIKNEYADNDVSRTINTSDISNPSFDRTKVEKVKTIVRVKHSKDYETDSYEMTPYVSAYDFFGNGDAGYEGGYKKEYYALNPDNPGDSVLDFESNYTRLPSNYNYGGYFGNTTPEKLRNFILAYNCNQHNVIKFRLPLQYINLEITDIINFDGLINNIKCFGEDYTQEYTRNGQIIYPYFMITNITKGTKHIDIECIQMHNLNRRTDILIQGSGDFNIDGIADQDDFDALQDYLLYPHEYITEGQKYNCDLNNDGVIDENDLSIFSEMIEGSDPPILTEDIEVQ